ncbi:hypothetical protein [Flavobacterium rhizosphaerae]|uniref:Uncharacterized protein n=1 Tax=Flavobacterium rhizosphaerae TaxID=3163298 RepID=A0ABW8YV38_9FLAO
MDNDLIKNVRKRWLYGLFELSHIDYQRKVWLGKSANLLSSFDEAICSYFDDLDLNDDYSDFIRDGFATQEEIAILMSFHSGLDNYINNPGKKVFYNKEVLGDKEWIALTYIGNKAWKLLKQNIRDEQELLLISELEKS